MEYDEFVYLLERYIDDLDVAYKLSDSYKHHLKRELNTGKVYLHRMVSVASDVITERSHEGVIDMYVLLVLVLATKLQVLGPYRSSVEAHRASPMPGARDLFESLETLTYIQDTKSLYEALRASYEGQGLEVLKSLGGLEYVFQVASLCALERLQLLMESKR